ncbi:MAG: GtrA family protein [Candidatus Ruminococcus intestinipullorum]|nr:GtrA family protein [Candidatus Ruminococcus intestinipullorum]
MEKEKKSLVQQILRFGIVGGSAFVIDYGIMIFLTELVGVNYLLSCGISFAVSVVYNYILSICWVFNISGQRSKQQDFFIFMLLSIIGLGINQLMMWVCVECVGIFYMLAKIIATAIVMVYNFVTRKLFLEKA